MSLRDKACYTLTLVPSLKDPGVLELVENYGSTAQATRYGRVREPNRGGEVYSAALYDAFSGAKLASTGLVNEKLRSRRLELHGPDERVPFEFTGKLGFEWSFTFEGNTYMWKRDGGITSKDMACFMDRRPDPNIDIGLGRAASRDKPAQLSILHYNIERFMGDAIKDLRGLETLLATSFVALTDGADSAANSRQSSGSQAQNKPAQNKPAQNKPLPAGPPAAADPPRPSPPQEVYIEDANEVIVGVRTDLDGHIARAIGLLEDPSVLFIIIRTRDAAAAQRALQVVLGVTRYRHRGGMPDLRQYVIEEEAPQENKGPKVIKLDAPDPKPSWKPPPNLAIYLSTIELPDLKPGPGRSNSSSSKRPSPVGASKTGPAQVVAPSSNGGGDKWAAPPPPRHRPVSASGFARPVSPNPSFNRPVSPNPNPRPTSYVGLLNASVGGQPNRPVSFSGSLTPNSNPNSNFSPPSAYQPPSGFQPISTSAFPPSSPNPPSGFQPNALASDHQAPLPPPSAPQWGAPGLGGGGYSENPFRHGLFRPN